MKPGRVAMVATPSATGTELRILNGTVVVPPAVWGLSRHPGADVCERLLMDGAASEATDLVSVEHAAIAGLTAHQAAQLELPPATSLRAVVEGDGFPMRPGFKLSLRWTRPGGQNVLGIQRVGPWLHEADGWRRLPAALFAVCEAVDAYCAVGGDEPARVRALLTLRAALPPAAMAGVAEGTGLLGRITIVEADAFSLDTEGEGESLRLVPLLHRAGAGPNPLLPADQQRLFGVEQFHRWPTARGIYTLPGGVYVVLSQPLRQAMEIVRRAAAAPIGERLAFLREPRAAIREAIGDEADAALLDSLVVETPTWSDRVVGLGLWQPRVLPWVSIAGNDWFGEPLKGGEQTPKGLLVGDQRLPLTPEQALALAVQVASAMADGRTTVGVSTDAGPVNVPATAATLIALKGLQKSGHSQSDASELPSNLPEVLVIRANETDRDMEAHVLQRMSLSMHVPARLLTKLKEHQTEGLSWLQHNWIAGSSGVLLADDMGLGKTLQGLAFLAWLRDAMDGGQIPSAPLLVVAPTGLLDNWQAEHDRHLKMPGLGKPLLAYGKGLAALRRKTADGSTSLDLDRLRAAAWVLTTYETLRDHDRDFGAVRFAAMLLDEAQKVKTPGIRLTDAAKAMNADFRIALTGTPVENRLADLWCIVDGLVPGHLGDLKAFSSTYEAAPNQERLIELKASLDRPFAGRPALLLRRLKEDRLPDLPTRTDKVLRGEMPRVQLDAYEAAIALGRSDQGAGRVLEALQRLRAVSLHPEPDGSIDDAGLIAGSVRLRLAVIALDEIAKRGEQALLFLDNLDLMARLAGLLQRRYALATTPMAISGKVPGAARQARVDRFQAGSDGFDVMLLSPRAGGVGLTLTRASHVIHLARWWNPAVEDQCTARVLRIGQTRPVTVHIPLACLPGGRASFDDNLHSLLERKRILMRSALLPPKAEANELSSMLSSSLQ